MTATAWRRLTVATLAAGLAAGVAWGAKQPLPPTAPAVQNVLNCRQIADDKERLACFDKTVAGMATAETTGDLVAIDKAQRRAARRQAFGLPLPSLGFL